VLCAAGGAAPAVAASDPVYVRIGPDGQPLFANHDIGGTAALLLAGDTPQVDSFRRRFRAVQHRSGETAASVPPRSRGLPRRHDPVLAAMVEAAAARAGLNPDLVRAVVLVESGFQVAARSHAGALGLMQLMPATARRFGVRDTAELLRDPEVNLRAGTGYLAYLLRMFDGDVRLALAGYNAGEGAVIKHGRRVPPYAETQAYVPAVLSAWRSYSEAAASAQEPGRTISSRE
jgi:soluble lytic murein transglycosylase-like protein